MDEASELPVPETLLQKITGLPLIGGYITTIVAGFPAGILLAMWSRPQDEMTGGSMIAAGLLSVWWLRYLERVGRITVTTPHIPIPLLWLLPLLILAGVWKLLGG